MTDNLTIAKKRATVKLAKANTNLQAMDEAWRTERHDAVLKAWREQAIREAEDALAVAGELGMEMNERNSA